MERDSSRKVLVITVLVSLILHVGIVVLSPDTPSEPTRKPKPEPVRVEIRKEHVKLIEAEEERPPEPEKKVEPPPAPKKIDEPIKKKAPPEKKPPEKKPPEPEVAKKVEPAEKPAEPPPETRKKPAPLVLKNVALNGEVAVQTGDESNLFGSASISAKDWKKDKDLPISDGNGAKGEGGDAKVERKIVIKPPQPLNRVKGKYPDEHRDLNRVVRVVLLLNVDPEGNVGEVSVKKGDLPAFNEEAIKTVKRLKFSPATKDSVPISYKVKWTVAFLPEGE